MRLGLKRETSEATSEADALVSATIEEGRGGGKGQSGVLIDSNGQFEIEGDSGETRCTREIRH